MIWRRYKLTIFIACSLAGLSYVVWHNKKSPDLSPKIVETEIVSLKGIQQIETFIGTIQAKRSTVLAAKIRGILDITTNAGQQVKKNDVLARVIDVHSDQTYDLAAEKERLTKIQYERAQTLHQQGSLSKNTLEEKKNTWLDASKNKVDAQKNCAHTLIQAPFDGIVGIFKAQEGSLVHENDAIVSVFDPTTLEVKFDIPLQILGRIRDNATIFIGDGTYTLTHVQRMLDPTTHMCPAYLNIQGNDLIVGSTLDVNVVVEEEKNVLVIPYAAIFMKDGKTCVYRIEDKKAKLVNVTCGIRNKDSVSIKDGLHVGDTIVRCAPTRIYPNTLVRIHSGDKPA